VSTARWNDPEWRAGAVRWIDDQLTAHDLTRQGEVAFIHVRPWSAVAHVTAGENRWWFKASAAETSYEPALLGLLAAVAAPALLAPLALDAERGWSLHPDGGSTLRDLLASRPEGRFPHWEHVLPVHAHLQLAAAPLATDLLQVGVPDLTPSAIPGHVERLLSGRMLSEELCAKVRGWLPRLREAVAELSLTAVPMTVQHDDLHDNNILVGERGYRFVDWGDASVAHPFGVFLIVRRSVADQAGLHERDPELDRLRDAYLEPFDHLASRAQLERELDLASYLDGVARAESWRRALADATPEEVASYEDPVAGWLAEVVDTPVP
jgi:hypothetical protein